MVVITIYMNISHADGIRETVNLHDPHYPVKSVTCSIFSTPLKLILKLNDFTFDGEHYAQACDTSIGINVGPNNAIVFMGVLENKYLGSRTWEVILYKCFIDNIFLFGKHEVVKLAYFISYFKTVVVLYHFRMNKLSRCHFISLSEKTNDYFVPKTG